MLLLEQSPWLARGLQKNCQFFAGAVSKVVSVFLHPAWLGHVQHGASEQSVKNAVGLIGLPVSEAAPQVVEAIFHARAFFWLIRIIW